MWFQTKYIFLTEGSSTGGSKLNAFDNAMREAGIADFNIIRVTSIVPPNTEVRKLSSNGPIVGLGRMLPAVYTNLVSSELGSTISAGVAIGIPAENSRNSGVIFTAEGHVSKKRLKETLFCMIKEGMQEMRLINDFKFKYSISSEVVNEPNTCVFASAFFVDDDLFNIISN